MPSFTDVMGGESAPSVCRREIMSGTVSTSGEPREESSELALERGQEREQKAVVERIVKSAFLVRAPTRIKLLRYLFERRKTPPVREWEIARDVYGVQKREDYASGKVRGLIKELSDALDQYADADISPDEWRCFLPKVEGKEGYGLQMRNLSDAAGPVHRFWLAHLQPVRPLMIVCNEPDFYCDPAADTVIRISRRDAPGEEQDGQEPSDVLSALPEAFIKQLRPCHLYALSGEIRARDSIGKWFADHMGVKTAMKISRDMNISEIADCSPVLLGNRRTNKIIDAIAKRHQYSRFAYHVDASPFGTIEVRGFDERENILVEKYGATKSGKNLLLRDTPQPDRVVFSTVTRMPNPYGEGAITMLSAGYAKVLEEIALVLSDEDRMLELMEHPQWPRGRKLPRYFQGLFSVRLGPEDTDSRSVKPKLRCLRHFEKISE